MNLGVIQKEFCRVILDDEFVPPQSLDSISPERIAIYRNAYRATMMGCLSTIFERTKIWVGDDAFEAAAQDHIVRNPPFAKSLDDYGVGFDGTLARLFRDDPEVAELASIEWALHRNFCAADSEILTAATLDPARSDAAAWDDARIMFVSDLQLGTVTTNIAEIWPTIGNEDRLPEVILLNDPQCIAIWRREYLPCFRALPSDEVRALAALRGHATFGAICASLAEDMGGEPGAARAGQMLGRWLNEGMISNIWVAPS